MAAIIKLIDIDEAITNLRYKNKDTLKYKLIHTIRQYYTDEDSAASLQRIDTEELVKALWCIGDDPELVRSKKKNLSSVKSGINADLKSLYQEGKNPQGVIIGQNNVFDMSDEAKDKALGTIADVLREKGTDTIAKIAEVLKAVNDILSDSGSSLNIQGGSETINRMKDLILDLSRKIGFSIPDDSGPEDISKVAAERTPEQQLLEEIDAIGEIDIADEIVDEVVTDVSEEMTDEIIDEKEADLSREMIEETVDEATAEISVKVIDEIAEEALIEEIDQGIEDKIIEEIVDHVEKDSAEKAIEAAAEDGLIEETGQRAEETEGESVLGDSGEDTVEEIQDYEQESETTGEADSLEILDEGDAIDEAIEAVSDEVPVEETLVEDDLDEIQADSDVEEVEGEEALEEEGELVSEVIEEDLREKAEILAKLAEAAKILEKLGPDLSESIYSEEEIKEKAKLLSEEFDRDLSVRERFYNQHILIKGGDYTIGSKTTVKNELPERKVRFQDFYIGKFPVTNALFEVFVDRTGYRTTAERQGYGFVYTPRAQRRKNIITGAEEFIWNKHLQYKKVQGAFWYQPNGPNSSLYNKRRHPVVQISLEDARAFAAWTGKRIPTEKEWEAAARNFRGYVYPWGNQWKDNACNIEKSYFGDTTPVDKYLEFTGESGVADTLGNVLEWTLDIWESPESGEKNTDIYVVKGGSWISNNLVCLSSRYPMDRNTSSNVLGFRCVAI
ncbi:MAG TPA: SUMF1/EgtB/PvdO family nonheme iron enzyme [Syntrophales bacterium]|nr:SUMF1/EgtB/PvdO family nonheme iron enzyme [Syntrophales bacterium]